MRLFIIRHADPVPDQDLLTPAGLRQAEALARYLAQIKPDEIYGSPLKRSLQTMEPAAHALGLHPTLEDWLKELDWFLMWEPAARRSAWNLPGEIIRAESGYALPREIEAGFEEIKQASNKFLKKMGYPLVGRRYRVLGPNEKKIAVFTHGGLGLTWLAHLLDVPLTTFWSGFWLDPASITVIHFEQHSPEWAVPRCLTINDISYLRQEGLLPQASSIFKKFSTRQASS